jgi:subtilisin family serine protease
VFPVLAFGILSATTVSAAEHVIIRTAKPYGKVIAEIEARGGKVTHQFRYVDALAAEIPEQALAAVRALAGASAMQKDFIVPAPKSVDVPLRMPAQTEPEAQAERAGAFSPAQVAADPAAYSFNNELMGLVPLHGSGKLGNDVIVAVIDSGIRPGFQHIQPVLPGEQPTVIGGEDFVGDGRGYSNDSNGGHGTFVAGMIAANRAYLLPMNHPWVPAFMAQVPESVQVVSTPSGDRLRLPIVGSAPFAKIYALRVFGPTGGAPTSRIMMAMERAIELRKLYNAGQGGANIRVCNMSLGGSTVNPARDLYDQLADTMLANDIVLVVAAANAGPAALTIASPGSANGAVTVGAASTAKHERVLRQIQYGPANGPLYRPSSATHMAYFSSRGPNADGRTDPDVVANGFASLGQGTGNPALNSLSIGSGTSYASPSVAGVAAVLRQAFPAATATQIRNAIALSADPSEVAGATAIDQGRGFINGAAAAALLAAGSVPSSLTPLPNANPNVKVNIEQNSDLKVIDGVAAVQLSGLKPGQRRDVVYRVLPNTRQVVISIGDLITAPPAQQNQLFGDDLLIAVHSAKTSAIGDGDYPVPVAFVKGGTWVVDNPEPGLMRISVSGDWTNASPVSGKVNVVSHSAALPQLSRQGKLADGSSVLVPFTVPAGSKQLEVRLGWRDDWASFPTADLDLILFKPDNTTVLDAATISNPEKVSITNPAAGQWVALVDGFEIPRGEDKYELRISIDGVVVK